MARLFGRQAATFFLGVLFLAVSLRRFWTYLASGWGR